MTIPTAPGALPLLGHALKLMRNPLEFVEGMRAQGDVVEFRLGPRPAYLVNTPELVREVLITQMPAFSKGGPLAGEAAKLLGNGLATANGDFHRRQRHLSRPAFHHERIAAYTAAMSELAAEKSESWHEGQEVHMGHEMHALSMSILTRTLFASPDGVDAAAIVREALPHLIDGIGRRAYLPLAWVHQLPLPMNRRFAQAERSLHELVDLVLADYRAHPADRGDLLSMLMTSRDDQGEGMTDRQLHDEIITMMLAGSETPAATVVWALHVLAEHPDVEKMVHAEVDEVLAGRPATHADLERLDYVRRVVAETLRMYPVGWLFTRHTTAPVALGGHTIPAGSDVFYSPYVLHHDPALFPSPSTFDPDRWLPERASEIPRHAYIPFSAGFRKCIGDGFSLTQMTITLATLASRWRPRPVGRSRTVASTSYRLEDAVMRLAAR